MEKRGQDTKHDLNRENEANKNKVLVRYELLGYL